MLLESSMADCSCKECFSLVLFTHLPSCLALILGPSLLCGNGRHSGTNGTYFLYPNAKHFEHSKRHDWELHRLPEKLSIHFITCKYLELSFLGRVAVDLKKKCTNMAIFTLLTDFKHLLMHLRFWGAVQNPYTFFKETQLVWDSSHLPL